MQFYKLHHLSSNRSTSTRLSEVSCDQPEHVVADDQEGVHGGRSGHKGVHIQVVSLAPSSAASDVDGGAGSFGQPLVDFLAPILNQ
jgi:hypothetical protein